MRFRSIAVGLLSFGLADHATAQAPSDCPSGNASQAATQDACQQAVDLFRYMAPQLGTAITGGNTTLAQGGSMGGRRFGLVPRFAVGVRANAVLGNVPELQQPTLTITRRTNNPTTSAIIPMPAVDLAVGVFKGFPLALTNVGGVDVLLSAAYVPEVTLDNITVTPDSPIKFGYGVRIGLLQESLVIPGVGFSIMQRGLPVTTITGTAGTGATATTLTVADIDLNSTAWRLTVSKSLLLFGLALGAGQDRYSASTSISVTPPAPGTPTTPFPVEQNMTRMNYFADVSMNLVVLKLVGTVGMVSGGEVTTYNTYDNPADKSRLYASVGLRAGL